MQLGEKLEDVFICGILSRLAAVGVYEGAVGLEVGLLDLRLPASQSQKCK